MTAPDSPAPMAASTDAGFLVELADWSNANDLLRLRAVRDAVFILEQNVPAALEWDDDDARSQHVLALEVDSGRAIGCGRLTPERTIGRMAVVQDWRGRGVGAALLRTLMEKARERGMLQVSLHSQTHALDFYRRFGFSELGEEYEEAGIPHRNMSASIASPPVIETPSITISRTATHTVHEAMDWLDRVAAQARHHLSISSHDGNPELFGRREFVAHVQRIALSGRAATIRLLLRDTRRMARDGHRLLELSRRLPSFIEIRRVEVDESGLDGDAFVLDDLRGVFWQPRHDEVPAEASLHDPHRSTALGARFEHHWQRAQPDPALRQL